MKLRLGVFATARGWVVANRDQQQRFDSRGEAMLTARRQAGLARWRGDEAEILAQDLPGGPLAVIDPRRL